MNSRQLKINEIFYSIQGESTHAGRPCAFVRLMACPLRCTYCDTEYAFYEGKTKSFDEIFEVLKSYPTKLVEVTGGEPLAQPNAIPFMEELLARGYEVLIETSGALPIQSIPAAVKVIMDLKTPGSGEVARNHWDNMAYLKPGLDEVKFVICNREDFNFAVEKSAQYKLFDKVTVLASPSHKDLKPMDLAEWVLESGLPFRMQLQLHKYVWSQDTRGV